MLTWRNGAVVDIKGLVVTAPMHVNATRVEDWKFKSYQQTLFLVISQTQSGRWKSNIFCQLKVGEVAISKRHTLLVDTVVFCVQWGDQQSRGQWLCNVEIFYSQIWNVQIFFKQIWNVRIFVNYKVINNLSNYLCNTLNACSDFYKDYDVELNRT